MVNRGALHGAFRDRRTCHFSVNFFQQIILQASDSTLDVQLPPFWSGGDESNADHLARSFERGPVTSFVMMF